MLPKRRSEPTRALARLGDDPTRGNDSPTLTERDSLTSPLSKTKRKAHMHALQDLGEALVALPANRLDSLDLPDRLHDAIDAARAITRWGARRRQLQYVGRLMRDINPQPIAAQLAQWTHGSHADTARLHELERWRERLLGEDDALDELYARFPTSNFTRREWRSLITAAQGEVARNLAPRHYRELFRRLKALFANGL